MAAATANPGIQFKVGQSLSDLSALGRELGAIRKQLQGIRQDAQQAASGLNQINGGLVNRHGQPLRQPEPEAPKTTRQARQQKAPAANADRNIFQGMTGTTGMSDAEWRELGKKQAKRREEALKAGMELNPTERREFARTRAVNASMRARTGEDVQGLLGRAVNAIGWSPFMPQSAYMLQMMLGEMGLGLSLPLVAGGMGVAGLGAGALALNAYAANQQRTGQQLVSAVGTNGPFAANAYTTAADEAQLLQQRAGRLHLTTDQTQQAVSGLAAGGLSGNDAFGLALSNTAELVNVFGMSVQDATDYVTTLRTNLGMTDQQVNQALAGLAKTAEATGQPLASLGQILEQTPNLIANLTNPADQAAAASMYRALGGSTQGALALASPLNASGSAALSVAGQLGYSPAQFDALKQTRGGQAQIASRTIQKLRDFYTQSGGVEDIALVRAQALLGSGLTQSTYDRLRKLSPSAPAADLLNALQAPSAAAVGSAGQALAQAAAGQPGAAAATANPWNVKDMAVNAAQVFLTGAVSQAGTVGTLLTSGGSLSTAQLRQIAAKGGVAATAANAELVGRGNLGALGALWAQLASGALSAVAAVANPGGAGTAQAVAGAIGSATGHGGGGGGGQVITLNLRTDGRQVAALPVKIGPNQQYDQYVPSWHAPGRGQQ